MRTPDQMLPTQAALMQTICAPGKENGMCLTITELTLAELQTMIEIVHEGDVVVETIDGEIYVRPNGTASEIIKAGWLADILLGSSSHLGHPKSRRP